MWIENYTDIDKHAMKIISRIKNLSFNKKIKSNY